MSSGIGWSNFWTARPTALEGDRPAAVDHLVIVGTGAMACLFGAALAPHTRVTLLGRWEQGVQAVREEGIRVDAPDRHRAVRVSATLETAELAGAESALVLVKSWQTEDAGRRLAGFLAHDGLALTLQNGLGNLETLQRTLGEARAALGVTTVGATLLGPGRVRPGGEGLIYLPEDPRLESFRRLFERGGFSVRAVDGLQGLVWGKLAVNAGINPLTALLRLRNGALVKRKDARAVLEAAVSEVAAVARAVGVDMAFEDPVAETLDVARRTGQNRSSMLQDMLRGAPTEIDAICGAVVRRGAEMGVPTPVNETLWRLVRAAAEGRDQD